MVRKRAANLSIGLFLTVGVVISLLSCGICFAQNFEAKYVLIKDQVSYQLTVSVTSSLYQYYQQKSHLLTPDSFPNFVTPYSLEPLAEDIRSIFSDDESFVNAVLMLVHQIPYQLVEGAKYPVETMVENYGDCDLLSYVAASLLKAQNIDTVLLYYEYEAHMNIGVSLADPPDSARTTITYIEENGTRYYIAECTGDDWQDGWRVGECPPELRRAQVTVVKLDNCEQIAPGQVSSSFGTLIPSTISLVASQTLVIEGSKVLLTGQISNSSSSGIVVLYATTDGNWFSIGEVEPNSEGKYSFSWTSKGWGTYYLRASWSGDSEHAGANSENVFILVIPQTMVFVAGIGIVAIVIIIVLALMRSTTHTTEQIEYCLNQE